LVWVSFLFKTFLKVIFSKLNLITCVIFILKSLYFEFFNERKCGYYLRVYGLIGDVMMRNMKIMKKNYRGAMMKMSKLFIEGLFVILLMERIGNKNNKNLGDEDHSLFI